MKEGKLLHKVYSKMITLQDSLLTSDGESAPDGWCVFDDEDDTTDPVL